MMFTDFTLAGSFQAIYALFVGGNKFMHLHEDSFQTFYVSVVSARKIYVRCFLNKLYTLINITPQFVACHKLILFELV